MIAFDEQLRRRVRQNLRAHDRRELPLAGRRHAAVAVVILDRDVDGRRGVGAPLQPEAGGAGFLLCMRPAKLRRHAGQWALPGGRLEPGEGPLDAALRELHEELGVQLSPSDVVGYLDDYGTRSGFVMTPVVLWCVGTTRLTPDPDEVAAVHQIDLQALLDSRPRFIEIPQSPHPVLQLPLAGDVIHAPTGAILYQFRQVGLRGRIGERLDGLEEPVFAWR